MNEIAPVLKADLGEIGHQIMIPDRLFQSLSQDGAVFGQSGENAACIQYELNEKLGAVRIIEESLVEHFRIDLKDKRDGTSIGIRTLIF
jgi:hypothetical protein